MLLPVHAFVIVWSSNSAMTSSCTAGLSCWPAARRGKCRRFTMGRAASVPGSAIGACSVMSAFASR